MPKQPHHLLVMLGSSLPRSLWYIAQSSADGQDCDWSLAARAYPDLLEMPPFVAQQRQQYQSEPTSTTADPRRLQGRQLRAYNIVCEHSEAKTAHGSERHGLSGWWSLALRELESPTSSSA